MNGELPLKSKMGIFQTRDLYRNEGTVKRKLEGKHKKSNP